MIENAGKYLKKKQGAEYARILNVIDVVQINEDLSRQAYSEIVKHLRWRVLQKE